MRDTHEYQIFAKPKEAGELEALLNRLGQDGYEVWPLIHQNGGGGDPFLIFHRETRSWDTPWEERVDKMYAGVITEFFDPEVMDDEGRDKLRKVINFVMNEC